MTLRSGARGRMPGRIGHVCIVDGGRIVSFPAQSITAVEETLRSSWRSRWSATLARRRFATPSHLLLLGNPVYVNWGPASQANTPRHMTPVHTLSANCARELQFLAAAF